MNTNFLIPLIAAGALLTACAQRDDNQTTRTDGEGTTSSSGPAGQTSGDTATSPSAAGETSTTPDTATSPASPSETPNSDAPPSNPPAPGN